MPQFTRQMFTAYFLKIAVLVDCCPKISTPQLNDLRQEAFIISWGKEFRWGLAGCFWLGVAHTVADKLSTGATSSEHLAGPGGPASKQAHSCGAGSWQETSVSPHMGLSVDCMSSKYHA